MRSVRIVELQVTVNNTKTLWNHKYNTYSEYSELLIMSADGR